MCIILNQMDEKVMLKILLRSIILVEEVDEVEDDEVLVEVEEVLVVEIEDKMVWSSVIGEV